MLRLSTSLCLLALTSGLPAQNPQKTLLFVGRFDFVSLATGERPGGSLTPIEEFDIAYVTPGRGAVARSWLPATAHQAMLGDSDKDGNHLGLSTIPDNWDFAAPFVKYADLSRPNPPVYLTVRDDRVKSVRFMVFTANGSGTRLVRSGDWFRLLPNGNAEFFITQDLIKKAKGTHPGGRPDSFGASALMQDKDGNLYWSPQERGCWVRGNDPNPANVRWCHRAGVIMLNAKDITYDSAGNVKDVKADAAHVIFDGNQPGPNGQPSIYDMVKNAGSMDFNGSPVTSFYNTVGLALDPAGGTITASVPRLVGTQAIYDKVPNFVFTSDSGTRAATIFSTLPRPKTGLAGSVAVINGVKCGSDQAGKPADGSWLGVKLDKAAFSPTTMGIALIDAGYDPVHADAPKFGAIDPTDNDFFVDVQAGAGRPTLLVLTLGPNGPGTFGPAADVSGLFGPKSFPYVYVVNQPPLTTALPLTNAGGFTSLKIPNPKVPSYKGLTLMAQVARLAPSLSLSTPVLFQFK